MEFGTLPEKELIAAELHLPSTPEGTMQVLNGQKKNTEFFVGCPRWGRKDWVGKYYPAGTKERDFLKHYATQFNSIEFNGFFYNLYSPEQVEKWAGMVPDGFLFCPKFTQSITHIHRLQNVDNEVEQFLSVVDHFGDHLGPIFLMPHSLMDKSHLSTLISFLDSLPAHLKTFVELRHEEWYRDASGYDKTLYEYLTSHNRGTIITDAAGRRDCVHMHLSTPECFIRFVGNNLHPTDFTRIDAWVAKIGEWMKYGLERCYFFVHQQDDLHSPELIRYFARQMNEQYGTCIKLPQAYEQNILF